MILISTPIEEYRVELIKRLKARDPDHRVYETVLPPKDVPYPFYYLEELRAPDNLSNKREVMQEVYHSVSVWHDNPDKVAEVLRMLGLVGEVIRELAQDGTGHYDWMLIETGTRVLSDRISDGKTVYVHGIYEIHLKQIGSR